MAVNEILSLLEYIEQERGINKDELIGALEKALISAGKKSFEYGKDFKVQIDVHTGKITAWIELEVSDEETKGEKININDAKKILKNAKVGDIITKEVPQNEFGRIAAQTARQTMLQQLRKAEKLKVYDEFKDSLGTIVSGTVRRFETGNVIIDFQKAEGILSSKDKIPGDKYVIGDRINALLMEIDNSGTGPSLILNRSSRKFLKKLFEREIAEIGDGIVEIKGIARDPGVRSKIAVISHDPKIDPIGACIGVRGNRVKNITSELGGERIDIIRWDEDLIKFITNAMQPATPKSVEIDEENKLVKVYVDESQVRLAIGKGWQNVRLCSQLIGMKVNVLPVEGEEKTFETKLKETVSSLSKELGISVELSEKLVNNGILSVESIKETSKEDLTAIEGITEEEVSLLLTKIKKEE